MSEFKRHRLADLYEISSGISTTKDQAGHGAPFVAFKDIYNNYFIPERLTELMDTTPEQQEKFSVREGDVFLTRTSETLDELAMSSVALQDHPNATFSGFAKRLRPRDPSNPDPRFMGFFLRSEYFRRIINSVTTMTTRASFNEAIFSHVEVDLPDLDSQVQIGDLLYSIEQQIELNNQVNDSLQAMLQTLYGYWFLQFNFPDENGRPYRASGGRMVWNSQLKREIPAGWRVASLVSNPLCEPLKPGVAPFSEKTYLATADVVGTTIKDGSRIRYETREGRANMEPVLHSVWFAKMKGSVKHLFLNEACASLISETILSTGFVGLKCEPVAFEYIASFIASEQFEPLKDLHAHGATQQAVNNTDLENILLPIPDAETLRRFSQLASSTLSRFNASIVENKRLQELRDWLLPMLMNGQATVASSDKLSFI